MTRPDFPAAHSMDTTWFAVDAEGHVAHFDTGENGAVPHAWLGGQETGYEVADTLIALDFRQRFVRGEVRGPARAIDDGFLILPDTTNLIYFGETVLIDDTPAVIRVTDADLIEMYLERGDVLASLASTWEVDFAPLGVFGYEHDYGAPGCYDCDGLPSAPLKVDSLPFATRNTLAQVSLDTTFGPTPFQLADHTTAARYWSGNVSLRGVPDDGIREAAPHPVLSWLGDEARAADRKHYVECNDLVLPVVTTLLAAEGLTLSDVSDTIAHQIKQLIARLTKQPALPFSPIEGLVTLDERGTTSVLGLLRAVFAQVARRRDPNMELGIACRYTAGRAEVSRTKLLRTLRVDLRTAAVQDNLRMSSPTKLQNLALETVFYADREGRVVLAQEVHGEAMLHRQGRPRVRGPIKELLAMLDEPHFTPATQAALGATTQLYRMPSRA